MIEIGLTTKQNREAAFKNAHFFEGGPFDLFIDNRLFLDVHGELKMKKVKMFISKKPQLSVDFEAVSSVP